MMKRIVYLILLMFLASCSSMERYEDTDPSAGARGLAQSDASDFSSEHFVGIYSPVAKDKSGAIKKMKIKLSPFGGSISFRSRKQILNSKGLEITNEMDCMPNADSTGWLCRSGCESGYISVRFNGGVKLDRIQVQPFDITMCSGNEPVENGDLASKTAVKFMIRNLKLEK